MAHLPTSFRVFSALGFCFALAASTGCKDDEDPDTRAFEEGGVWSLQDYALDGAQIGPVSTSRIDNYMLRFDESTSLVAAATCGIDDGDFQGSLGSPGCVSDSSKVTWRCRCFAYVFENEEMIWQEFDVDTDPPEEVIIPEDDAGGTGDVDPEGVTTVIAATNREDSKALKQFMPLPWDLFESNGETSTYLLQQRAPSVWAGEDNWAEANTCAERCSLSDPS